ncbi:uncharacterized protein LOC113515043 [Galleria mellonella]|uniref:Uncharacterized protein LOC113515043 n=1 Tax=Galleria mellonella TaxID=7137 RepID=A0A6J1WJW9_GALME|nr:uncharacterized protein LOC113515043 [Galleria mellonella]
MASKKKTVTVKIELEPQQETAPRKKLRHLSVHEKTMAINLYKYVEESWPVDKFPYKSDIMEKTASLCDINKNTMARLLADYRKFGHFKDNHHYKRNTKIYNKLSNFDKSMIKKKIYNYYLNGKLPRTSSVFDEVNSDKSLPDFTRSTFYRVLKEMGYKFIRRQGETVVTDRDKIIIMRRNYLNKIRKHKAQNHPIYYIDETWIPGASGRSTVTSKQTTTILDEPKRIIIMHTDVGGVIDNSIYCFNSKIKVLDTRETADAENFEKWFEDLLPKLLKNSVVVMSNASHHCRLHERTPNILWTKENITDWMRKKDVPFEESDLKCELLIKAKEAIKKYEAYALDVMAAKHNIEVLRLPEFHSELSPIEIVFKGIKAKIPQTDDFRETYKYFDESLASITTEQWRSAAERVKEEEETLYKLDTLMDQTIDNLFFNIKDIGAYSDTDTDSTMSCSDAINSTDFMIKEEREVD